MDGLVVAIVFVSARLAAAALLGAALGVAGYWLVGLLSIKHLAPPVVIDGGRFKLVEGRGRATSRGVDVRYVGRLGIASVIATVAELNSQHYQSVSWDATGLEDARAVRLLWRIGAHPGVTRSRLLTAEELRVGGVDLKGESDWKGNVVDIGFLIQGPLGREIALNRVSLTAEHPLLLASLAELARPWGYAEPWTQRSINFYAGSSPGSNVMPVATIALWIGLSLAIYRLMGGTIVGSPGRTALALLVLAGWLALDLRWQWVLQARLDWTLAQYARARTDSSLSSQDRILLKADEALGRVAAEMRRRLPEQPSRIFILSEDPGGYVPGRLRYLLAPHRGYLHSSHLPSRHEVQASDFFFLVSPLDTIRYDQAQRALKWKRRSLPVDIVYTSRFGDLFRVRGGRR
jgi:hypothetical protein